MPSDDIVTRLKWLGCQYDNSCITCEAADEIERLRAGFQLMAKAYAADLGMDRHGWDADKMCEEFLRKAVRDAV